MREKILFWLSMIPPAFVVAALIYAGLATRYGPHRVDAMTRGEGGEK